MMSSVHTSSKLAFADPHSRSMYLDDRACLFSMQSKLWGGDEYMGIHWLLVVFSIQYTPVQCFSLTLVANWPSLPLLVFKTALRSKGNA